MRKFTKKIVSILLSVMLVIGIAAPVASAAFEPGTSVNDSVSTIEKVLYNVVDKVIDVAVGAINKFVPTPKTWTDKADFTYDGFMPGTEQFLDTPAEGAYWSVGYSNASILMGNELDGKHFVGGSLSVSDKVATSVIDDLKVRTIAMSDNSGRGTVVFAVVDSYGLASSEVRAIRAALADLCAEKNIVSLNVAVLHQHSAVDTFGMNGSIVKALVNPFRSEPVNGINKEYNENLYKVVAKTVSEAVDNMTAGKLYYGTVDCAAFATDKRDPQVLETNFDRFRFVPDNGEKETWFTTSCIHCVGNGAGRTDITGDYPYYMEQVINEKYNANFMMMLTAEQGTTQDGSTVRSEGETMTTAEYLTAYGTALAERFASITDETEVAPVLNIKSQVVYYKITNQILIFAGKMGLLTNTVVKNDGKFEVATEIGYMELGTDIAVALVPGEGAAELFSGGCLSAADSWTGTDWSLAPVANEVGDKKLIVFGIINDQIGYIIPDNDYMALLSPINKSLELVSTGSNTASAMVKDFAALISSVK